MDFFDLMSVGHEIEYNGETYLLIKVVNSVCQMAVKKDDNYPATIYLIPREKPEREK